MVNLFGGKGAALGLHVVAAQFAAMQFFNGVFNGQAVAVPAGNVLRVKARQLLGLDDHVFEYFVQGVTNVQFAVGVGWAVVQHKQRSTLACKTQFFVQALIAPSLGPSRLTFRQIAAHCKRGVGHVQSGTVICFLFGHCSKRHGVGTCKVASLAAKNARAS